MEVLCGGGRPAEHGPDISGRNARRKLDFSLLDHDYNVVEIRLCGLQTMV